jgi:hypothetical protein
MKTIEMIVDAALPDFEQKDGLVVSIGSIDLTRRLVSLVASASLARSSGERMKPRIISPLVKNICEFLSRDSGYVCTQGGGAAGIILCGSDVLLTRDRYQEKGRLLLSLEIVLDSSVLSGT